MYFNLYIKKCVNQHNSFYEDIFIFNINFMKEKNYNEFCFNKIDFIA